MLPGREGKLKVTVKTAGYYGKVSKTIALKSDDPVRPDVTLKVKMALVGSAILMPSNHLLLRYRMDKPTTGQLLVRQDPTESGTLAVSELTSSEPWLTVRTRKVEAEESLERGFKAGPGDFILEFEVPEKPGAGAFRAEVTFRTGLTREPVISIPVTFTARAFGVPSTRRLLLRRDRPDGPVSGKMSFRLLGKRDGAEVKVGITPDHYLAEVKLLDSGQLQVTVTENGDREDGGQLQGGELQFVLGAETVLVPVIPPQP
ncbi:MAG: hypothetical protein IFK94_11665 [Acidobacteria bacterium]|uniref:Uncharacterized protein n=1 Tax=Candidatus Polarisedimenticola svalbardensis TaxID=2886004 RepID=A0A8J7CLZ4_9BACT|nr:hypothetical protein [Candidatus Polarisedimenticola svalbardensis]